MLRKRIAYSAFAVLIATSLASCGGDGGSDNTTGVPGPGPATGDFLRLSINGGTEATHSEASGLPNIDCDPRVDWGSFQVILWDNFTNGTGPNGYDLFLDIMFPAADTVGTYTVHGDSFQAIFYNGGVNYSASPLLATSGGTVQVTRADTRIEGTYAITVVDASETTSVTLTGSFGVDRGFSLSCP